MKNRIVYEFTKANSQSRDYMNVTAIEIAASTIKKTGNAMIFFCTVRFYSSDEKIAP